ATAAPMPARRLERVAVPAPPDLERHVLRDVPLSHVFPYLNLQMLYGKHLGLRGLVERLLESGDAKALELREIVEGLERDAVAGGLVRAHGAYRWYRARAAGDTVTLFDASGGEAGRFEFPRQKDGERLCLADYLRDDTDDYLALFAVTCGTGVREVASAWKDRGEYVRSHALQALPVHHPAASDFEAACREGHPRRNGREPVIRRGPGSEARGVGLELDLDPYRRDAERPLISLHPDRQARVADVIGVQLKDVREGALDLDGHPERPAEAELEVATVDRNDAVLDVPQRRYTCEGRREVGFAEECPGHDDELTRVHQVVALDHHRERPTERTLAGGQAQIVGSRGVHRALRGRRSDQQHPRRAERASELRPAGKPSDRGPPATRDRTRHEVAIGVSEVHVLGDFVENHIRQRIRIGPILRQIPLRLRFGSVLPRQGGRGLDHQGEQQKHQ